MSEFCNKPNCQKRLLQARGIDTSGMNEICEVEISSTVLDLEKLFVENKEGFEAYIEDCGDKGRIKEKIKRQVGISKP